MQSGKAEAPRPYQTDRERFTDDPAVLLDLPPLEKINEFWKRYDHLADIHDQKLTTNLNGNLDVLLIFAALFSAINTAFISLSMPGLSPDSSEETNALLRFIATKMDNNTLTALDPAEPFAPSSNSVIVNSLLYASLSCSLLAAVGAMMAKEWLQSFDRTGQTGPLEEQGRFRQNKFNGVEQWHLEAVIKFLPNLLLLSVVLFFAGIGIYLFPINIVVAGVVIAFSGLGAVLSAVTIVAGAVSPLCPYQSASSHALRRIYDFLLRAWRSTGYTLLRWTAGVKDTLFESESLAMAQRMWTALRRKARQLLMRVRVRRNRSMSPTPASPPTFDILSVSLTVPEENGILGRVRYHPAVRRLALAISGLLARIQLIGRRIRLSWMHRGNNTHAWDPWSDNYESNPPPELAQGVDSTVIANAQAACWLLETTSNRGDQITACQFVCTLNEASCAVAFEGSELWRRLLSMTCDSLDVWFSQPNHRNQEVAEAFGLALCHVILSSNDDGTPLIKLNDPSLRRVPGSLGNTFLQALRLAWTKFSPRNIEDGEYLLHICFIFVAISANGPAKMYSWVKLSRLIDQPHRLTDTLLGMWAVIAFQAASSMMPSYVKSETLMDIGENQVQLGQHIGYFTLWNSEAFLSLKGDPKAESGAAKLYTVCWRKAKHLMEQGVEIGRNELAWGVGDLIWSQIDAWTASVPADTHLVLLATEAVFALRSFIMKGSLMPENIIDVFSGQLLDAIQELLNNELAVLTEGLRDARHIRNCIIRLFLWVWKNRSDTEMERLGPEARASEMDYIFHSSCRLWDSLAREIGLWKSGNQSIHERPLTTDDTSKLVDFVEYIRNLEDKQSHHFIAYGADVGINRLYAHLDHGADWDYELFDLRGDRSYCCRLVCAEDRLL